MSKKFKWNPILQEEVDKIYNKYKSKMAWGDRPKQDATHSIVYYALQFYRVILIPRILKRDEQTEKKIGALDNLSKKYELINKLENSNKSQDKKIAKILREVFDER